MCACCLCVGLVFTRHRFGEDVRRLHQELTVLRESRKVVRTRFVRNGGRHDGFAGMHEVVQELAEERPLVV